MGTRAIAAVASLSALSLATSSVRALVVYSDNTPVFRDYYEGYELGSTPKFAPQGDYDLFEGSATVQNASPPALQGDQYMYLVRQPELNMRANLRDPNMNLLAVEPGHLFHAEFGVYADLSAGASTSPMNIQVLSNYASLEFALLANENGKIDYYRPNSGLTAGTLPWAANQWQIWKVDHLVGSGTLMLTIDGASEVFDFSGDPTNIGLTSIRFTGRTANNDRYAIDAVPPRWRLNGSGNWSVLANWQGGVPDGAEAIANFTDAITAAATVTLDSPRTIGTIRFDNPNSYTIAGASTLTIDKDLGGAAVSVISGSHTIATPISIVENTTVTVSPAGSTLALSGPVTVAAGFAVTKGGDGILLVENLRMPTLHINGGTVKVSQKATANDPAGTSILQVLDVTAAGRLDLTNNCAVIDYSGASPIDTVRQSLQTGASTGNGLITSAGTGSNGLGYAEASALGVTSFAGQTVDADSVLIKYTYLGDTNLDGQVDVIDLGNLATAWQTSAGWTGGDSNYDGFVDVIDLGLLATNWQAGVGSPLGPGSLSEALSSYGLPSAGVPEPALAGLTALPAVLAGRRRRPTPCY